MWTVAEQVLSISSRRSPAANRSSAEPPGTVIVISPRSVRWPLPVTMWLGSGMSRSDSARPGSTREKNSAPRRKLMCRTRQVRNARRCPMVDLALEGRMVMCERLGVMAYQSHHGEARQSCADRLPLRHIHDLHSTLLV